jgi:hypothetical protein
VKNLLSTQFDYVYSYHVYRMLYAMSLNVKGYRMTWNMFASQWKRAAYKIISSLGGHFYKEKRQKGLQSKW